MRMQLISVAQAFQDVLGAIEPLDSEVEALRSHRKTIRQAMRGEFAGFNRVEPIGSHTRGTAIRRHSDVDYLAVLGKSDVTRGGSRVSSTTTLGRVRSTLQLRFPRTAVRTDGPAVIVEFDTTKRTNAIRHVSVAVPNHLTFSTIPIFGMVSVLEPLRCFNHYRFLAKFSHVCLLRIKCGREAAILSPEKSK